ncbi:MAG: DUF2922 domain-containing protein [Clostridium sp.]
MEYSLTMVFLCQNGEKSNFTLTGVKENITEAEVSEIMNVIIEKNIFATKHGDLVTKYGASLTEKLTTSLNVRG